MQTFLERLAQYHISSHLTEINEFCFVFPSRRACLFFNRQLGQLVQQPIWAPKIITINEFFNEIDNTPVSDNISLLFKLHTSYCKVMSSDITIDDFLPLGEMLLSDFNDIDKYMAKPKEVFANLSAIKKLEGDYTHLSPEQIEAIRGFWDTFDPVRLSEQQESFLTVWDRLYDLYLHFRESLTGQHAAYDGMIIRRVAEKVRSEKSLVLPYKKVVFAGFNALNNSEKVLFHYLNIQNKATFFWDYPKKILQEIPDPVNPKIRVTHEAALFIKSNLNDYPPPADWAAPFSDETAEITISAASNELVQAQVAHDFLKEVALATTQKEKTALILADEQQLLPVLHSIPESYSSINITLGYPLKNTPAFSLVENLLAMQKTTRTTQAGKTWFYHRDVLALLRHQYMKTILEEGSQSLIHNLIASNQLFIESNRLTETPQLAAIFKKIESTAALTTYLNDLLIMVYRQLEKQGDKKLEMEFIFFLFTTIKRLSDILATLPQQPNPATWQSLFKKLAASQSVPFKGEPLEGLQIMGLLETRALDFENLIIIGMNEGVFPKTTPPNSFIPFNLRKGYGLPTIDNQDAIFAYYFYRLIHRAKKIKLVYTTSKSATEEGEMSRFLQQLYYEYPGKLKVETPLQSVTIPTQPVITASKSAEVMQILETYLSPEGKNLSPSALSTYIECPLRFYYRYVAKIKEPETIDEDLDPRVFGNLFHEMVELIYQPFVGKMVSENDLDQWLGDRARIKSSMDQIFEKNIPFIRQKSGEFTDLQGKNSLVYEILYKYIVRFLQCEKQVTPFRLLALEEKVQTKHSLSQMQTVNLGGTIDRTDEKEGMVRILDYKTGKAGKEFKEVEDLFNREKHSDNKAIFQTMLYGLIKSDNLGHNHIEPGVISVKELFKDQYDSRIMRTQNKKKSPVALEQVKEAFTDQLNALLTELFDASTPFVQTDHKKSCGYCVFNKHCLRE